MCVSECACVHAKSSFQFPQNRNEKKVQKPAATTTTTTTSKNLRNFSNWHASANANEFDYTCHSTHSILVYSSTSLVEVKFFGVRVPNA